MSVNSSMRKEQLVNVLLEALAEQVVLEEQVLHALTPAGFPAHDFERTRPQALFELENLKLQMQLAG